MRNKQTAAMKLFGLINNMSKLMQDAGDEQYANILKHIFDEYAGMTIAMEKEQIKSAYKDCHDLGHIYGLDTEDYYNKTYGNETN